MLLKMYFIHVDRLHGSLIMTRELVSLCKQRDRVKKRKQHHPYAENSKILKHHPYEEWLKVRQNTDEADLRKRQRRMHLQIF